MSMRPLRPAGGSLTLATTPPTPVTKQKACIPCRTRKVKCDKRSPCTNCASWDLECIFPSPVRRCSRPKKKVTASRSRSPVEEHAVAAEAEPGACTKVPSQSVDARIQELERTLQELNNSVGYNGLPCRGNSVGQSSHTIPDYSKDIERLEVIESMIGELKGKRDRIKFLGGERGIPPTGAFKNGSGKFIPQNITADRLFPFNSFAVEIAPLNPSLDQSQACWQVFLENVDQLVKVLHRPSSEEILQNASKDKCSLSKGQEALLFTIYFSSIISMTENDAEARFGMSKTGASMAYRSAAEQALMRADFLTTHNLVTLQAFVLFLSFNLYVDDAKLVWALTGLARRLCSSASDFSGNTTTLSPFEQEMHRRLWWQLWFLDRRAAEDQGKDNDNGSPPEQTEDPEFPLSIDDADLATSMATLPCARDNWTEMSFSLIRYEIARTSRRITDDKLHTPQYEKEKMINDCVSKIQSSHLQYCDGSDPIHWLAQHVSYVTVTEMWMQLHDQIQGCFFIPSPGSLQIHQMQVSRDQLFFAAIDIVDIPKRLETEPGAHRWKWLLKAYLQFHPLKFLLTELSRRLRESQESFQADFDEATNERARRVASFAFTRWTDENKRSKNGQILSQLQRETEEAWRERSRRERARIQVASAEAVDWQPSLEGSLLNQGGQLVGPQTIQSTMHARPMMEQQPSYMEDMAIVPPPSSMNYDNNTNITTDPSPYNNLSWSVDNRSHPITFDGGVCGYFAEASNVLGEDVYSF